MHIFVEYILVESSSHKFDRATSTTMDSASSFTLQYITVHYITLTIQGNRTWLVCSFVHTYTTALACTYTIHQPTKLHNETKITLRSTTEACSKCHTNSRRKLRNLCIPNKLQSHQASFLQAAYHAPGQLRQSRHQETGFPAAVSIQNRPCPHATR